MANHNPLTSFSRNIGLLIFSLFIVTGLAAGASVGFDQPGITVMPGEVTTVNLTLDAAPDGFSGYRILISVEDPSIGEVSAVTLPGWAGLPEITGVPGPEVGIAAIDLLSQVEKGASGIILATISLKGLSPGTTEILLVNPVFADDDGFDFAPILSNVSLTITTEVSTIPPTTIPATTTTSPVPDTTNATIPATTSGSALTAGSGGGGSGDVSYSTSTTTPATMPIPVTDGNDASVKATAEQTESPSPETSPAVLSTTLPGTTPPVTGSQGIPLLTVPGVLLLIWAMILLGRKMR